MKLALISDLHANRPAVEAVLADAQLQRVDRHVFLGDFVGYGADPGWVIDTVRTHVRAGALAVLGNHDEAVIQPHALGMRAQAMQAITWTRARLDAGQLEFLRQLPLQQTDEDRLYVHANAFEPAGWHYVQSRADAVRSLHATRCRYTFCGHMHEPKLFHLSAIGKAGDFVPEPGVAIPLPAHRQWLVIPGSAGQPRDGNPAACYATFDTHHRTLTYRRVPYDHDAAAASILKAGLPPDFAERLALGH
jgi:diadenosine tetraphosphatase ApaH/serine/threonine PP2A family protein phosphatase